MHDAVDQLPYGQSQQDYVDYWCICQIECFMAMSLCHRNTISSLELATLV
jgi:hypothetical protein